MYNLIKLLYKNFKYNFDYLKDFSYFLLKSFNLKKDKKYGFDKDLFTVDQLGNPNPVKVTEYYGFINDPAAAKRFGTSDLEEYSFWSWRSCGVANVVSILKTFNKYDGTLFDLVSELKTKEGYLFQDHYGNKDLGWKHFTLINTLESYGFKSKLLKRVTPYRVLLEILGGKVVIASVKSNLRFEGSHMIIVKGFSKTKKGLVLNIFSSYNLDGLGGNTTMPFKEFRRDFLRKGISVDFNSIPTNTI